MKKLIILSASLFFSLNALSLQPNTAECSAQVDAARVEANERINDIFASNNSTVKPSENAGSVQ